MHRIQWVILPIALLLSLLFPVFIESISSTLDSQKRNHVEYTPVRVVGWREDLAALCIDDPLQVGEQMTINVTNALRCALFRWNETPIVWLGPYRLNEVRIYDGSRPSVILVLEEGGRGEAYVLRGLTPQSEVYALLRGRNMITFLYLFRTVEEGELIEVRGSARRASKVEAFAYAAEEDFNASQPPLRSLYVTGGDVVNGRFLVRMEKGGAPFTRQGKPLLEINSTLVLHTGCSYAVINLTDLTASRGDIKLTINLDCGTEREQQAP